MRESPIVYPSREAAKKALLEYAQAANELEARFGIIVTYDDECADTYLSVNYYDTENVVRFLTL